ncbi:MAG: O-antigen ligase family protein, partial [Deltaproteobacteria bacterium]|nr:O-antigen ligase family protein [Deltaproteobacteria bacterium]
GGRISTPFEGGAGEPNTLGGYLLFTGLLTAGIAAYAPDLRKKAACLFLLAVMLFPFLFTQSRASYAALAPGAFVLAMLSRKRSVGFAVVALAFAGLLLAAPGPVRDRVAYTFTQPPHPGQVQILGVRLDTSTSARLQSWAQGLSAWTRHPMLGHGVTGYTFMDAQYVRVLVETGMAGLAAFLALLAAVFRMGAQRFKNASDPVGKGLTAGFLAGAAALAVHSLGVNTFIIVRIMEPFWFTAGLVAVLPGLESEHPLAKPPQTQPAWPRRPARRRN